MKPRYVKPGELLAMASTRLHQDRRGFFWMLGASPLPNERRGDVVIVHARGELEHHTDPCGAESYEGIVAKMRAAYAGESIDEEGVVTTEPPKAIALVIDSPGGVVSGLVACVEELQRMRAEHPEIRVSCYVDEMACSAAYALACSCAEIVCPPSAILGSIGVISTMVSATAADKKAGFEVRLITSGTRKADGNMHAPFTDAAIAAETTRVEKLALAFFRLAGKARKLSVDKIRSFQAGIFLGKDAIRVGLADRLAPIDAILVGASDPLAPAQEKKMDLAALIKTTKAALASEDDPTKLRELSVALANYSAALESWKKTEKFTEKTKSEEGEDDDEEKDDEEKDDEEKDDEEDAKSAKADDEEASASSDDEEASASSDDEKKDAKKALAAIYKATGMTGKKALGAFQSIVMANKQNTADLAALKRERAEDKKTALIAGAKGKYLTANEAKWLASQDTKTVAGFVEMRRKSGVIVNTDESTLVQPKASKPGSVEALPQFTRDTIDAAVASASGDKKKIREELEAAHLKAHNDQIARALNGAVEGRY